MEYMNLSSHKKMKKEKKILESYGMTIYMIIFFMLNEGWKLSKIMDFEFYFSSP